MKIRVIMLCMALGGSPLIPAFGAVIAPDQHVNGISQAELTANWWKWMISYPAATNPVLDTTGQSSYLGGDQASVSHPGVFFLAGNFSGAEARSVTVTDNQTLFLPFINTVSMIPFFGSNEAEIRADAASTLGTVTGLFARLDGVDLPLPVPVGSLSDFRQQSAVFSLTFPVDNIFGVPGGAYDSVTDGYWLALAPLDPGKYTLSFGASASGTPPAYPSFGLVQTYEITVTAAVPEPGTWLMLVAGLTGAGLLAGTRTRHRSVPSLKSTTVIARKPPNSLG